MKICYIIHGFQIGGAETIVANYLCELKKQGHDVYAISIATRKTFLSDMINVHGIPFFTLSPNCMITSLTEIVKIVLHKSNGWTKYYDRKLASLINKINPDIIHWHTNICYDSLLTFPQSAQFFTFHADVKRYLNLYSDTEKGKITDYVKQGLNIVVLNDMMLTDAKDVFENASITLIPNGLPLSKIKENRYDKKEFCSSINIPKNAFVLTMIGRFHPVKNQEWAIDVFSEILKKKSDAYLLYVGQEDPAIKKNIEERISRYNIPENRVLFLGLRTDATSILSVSDACLIPSFSESFSLVAVEAQAFNVRVVSSDSIPNSVLRNPNTFALSLKDSAEKWANAVLSDNLDVYKKGSIEDFNITNVVNKHVQLYKEALCQS